MVIYAQRSDNPKKRLLTCVYLSDVAKSPPRSCPLACQEGFRYTNGFTQFSFGPNWMKPPSDVRHY